MEAFNFGVKTRNTKDSSREIITLAKESKPYIFVNKVVYVKANGNGIHIHYKNENDEIDKIWLWQSMSNFLSGINSSDLIRCHRSSIINKNYIKGVSRNVIELDNGITVKLGPSYKKLISEL